MAHDHPRLAIHAWSRGIPISRLFVSSGRPGPVLLVSVSASCTVYYSHACPSHCALDRSSTRRVSLRSRYKLSFSVMQSCSHCSPRSRRTTGPGATGPTRPAGGGRGWGTIIVKQVSRACTRSPRCTAAGAARRTQARNYGSTAEVDFRMQALLVALLAALAAAHPTPDD